jgi:hypothetical protein
LQDRVILHPACRRGWKRNVYACNEEGVRRWRLQQLE